MADLISTLSGTTPLLILSGHDGVEELSTPRVPLFPGFTTKRDLYTTPLAEEIHARTSAKVIAVHVHRRFLDVNRPPLEAFSAPDARKVYKDYHARVRKELKGAALLVDLHGMADMGLDLLVGTTLGVSEPGICPVWGLVLRLSACGYKVGVNFPGFNGGWTLAYHGPETRHGAQAIQLEVSRALREGPGHVKLSQDLADALLETTNALHH